MNQESLQKHLLDAIGSVVPQRGGAYVAGPLATGKRYYELLASGQEQMASRVRKGNEEEMKLFVDSLRIRLPYPVIDPGLIRIPEWTATQTGNFYIKIIECFVKEIWFMDQWEYSRGATKEYQFAIAHKINCLDARGHMMPAEQGARMISDVVVHLTKLGIDASRFVDRVAGIRSTSF